MCKIVDGAIGIVNICIEKGIPINYLKVQKYAYLCQGLHLKKYGVPFAPEYPVRWSLGPGFREIFVFFDKMGLLDTDEDIKHPFPESYITDLSLLSFEKATIIEVLEIFGSLSFDELKELQKLGNFVTDIKIGHALSRKLILEHYLDMENYVLTKKDKESGVFLLSLEDLAANAFIEVLQRKNNRFLSYNILEEYGKEIVKILREQGSKCALSLSERQTESALVRYSKYFEETEINGDKGLILKRMILYNELIEKFRVYLPLEVLQAFINTRALVKLGI